MRVLAIALAACGCLAAPEAHARVAISVDLGSQTMHVASMSGDYDWPISSARAGFRTPRGSYGIQRMEVMHRSRKYHHSPMPHSLFFSAGYAIHGTYETAALGTPASHGCIRIAPENAAALYQMVRTEGARITITGGAPAETRLASRRERRIARAARREERALARGDAVDRSPALGYAPEEAPGLSQWMADPTSE